MRAGSCACGAVLYVPASMDLWTEAVLAHVRTKRHSDWSARQEPGVTMEILPPPTPTA